MNINKRVIISTTAVVAALAVGGGVWATAANADVPGADRDRLGSAAVQAVGGGTATDVDTSDDQGEAYEVEVRKADGTEVDVALDQDGKVIGRQIEAGDRASAEKAALEALAGGTVTDVEAGDDPGVAYDVEVRATDNTERDVELDTAFKVLTKTQDN